MSKRVPITAETMRRLRQVADSIPGIWNALAALGYKLPQTILAELRSFQVKDPSVLPTCDYFAEVMKERFTQFYTLWMPERRPSGKAGTYRSPYLDSLEALISKGAWSELGEARRHAIRSLDPGYMRYLELKISDPEDWLARLTRYKEQAASEARSLPDRYAGLCPSGGRSSPTAVYKIMSSVLGEVDCVSVGRKSTAPFVFSRKLIADDIKIFCGCYDPRQMHHGWWSLVIGFAAAADSLSDGTSDAVLILEGLNFYLPGGNVYMQHDGDAARAVLGLVVCAALLDHLAKAFDKPLSHS